MRRPTPAQRRALEYVRSRRDAGQVAAGLAIIGHTSAITLRRCLRHGWLVEAGWKPWVGETYDITVAGRQALEGVDDR